MMPLNEILVKLNDLYFIKLVMNASLLVQIVMALLLIISLYAWTLIFRKSFSLRRAQRAADNFENQFWRDKDLQALYNRITSYGSELTGLESIFIAGYTEFMRLRKNAQAPLDTLLEGTQRAMRVALRREMDDLDSQLSALATVGSVSPYIGLLGTVWGIMNSFHALGQMQQVTLSMVAPGISEALIATAMGLFAAIPAVMAYNSYTDDIERLLTRYDTFLDEFTGILQRQITMAAVSAQLETMSSHHSEPEPA